MEEGAANGSNKPAPETVAANGKTPVETAPPKPAPAKEDNGGPGVPGFVPTRIFLTKGVGRHKEKLNSFELALRDAKIAEYNLVRVSSIFPPGAKIVPASEGLRYMRPGQIVFCVLAECATNEPHRLISASIGMAIPRDTSMHGYLSEHHDCGMNDQQAGDYAEDLAAQMLATTLGVPFDSDKSYDEKMEQYKLGGEIVRTTEITQSAIGDKTGLWTTVVASAVLL
jgi:arginine decarboxylase